MHCFRISLVQVPCQARLAVGKISGMDAAAHETNHKQSFGRRTD
jgi:hypothetical protein